jgi:prolyl-tRNA editing enzyme YbaK/EbsC (Cys-tRNA(Pro) deacylase)
MEKMTGEKIRDQIFKLLKDKNINFERLIHKKAPNAIIGSQETGALLNQTIKTLLLRGKKSGKNYLVGILGDQRMNMKSFALVVGEACEFETTEIMQKRFGLEIGGVTPFLGLLFGLDIYFDEKILGCDKVLFGSGVPTESIRMNLKDLITIIQPNLVSISHTD